MLESFELITWQSMTSLSSPTNEGAKFLPNEAVTMQKLDKSFLLNDEPKISNQKFKSVEPVISKIIQFMCLFI